MLDRITEILPTPSLFGCHARLVQRCSVPALHRPHRCYNHFHPGNTESPMPDKATIYHNSRCSKSRAALEYLQQSDKQVEIIDYLKNPPDRQTLIDILNELQLRPADLMRPGEAVYKELNLQNDELSDEQLIALMIEHPILIERPIVRFNGEAAIGRPLDNIIELLDE